MAEFSSKKIKWTLVGVLMAVALIGAGFFIYDRTTNTVITKRVNTDEFGIAIKGYDTVAYHTEGRALKGKSTYSYTWNDAKWHFASAANRDLFATDPERYAPQYGGF